MASNHNNDGNKVDLKVKGKDRYSSSWWDPHLRAMGRHLPYGITQYYLPPDTSECAPPNPSSHAGWYSIYLPRRDGRLSWPSWLEGAPAGSQTSDFLITSPTPNHCITKTCGRSCCGHQWPSCCCHSLWPLLSNRYWTVLITFPLIQIKTTRRNEHKPHTCIACVYYAEHVVDVLDWFCE